MLQCETCPRTFTGGKCFRKHVLKCEASRTTCFLCDTDVPTGLANMHFQNEHSAPDCDHCGVTFQNVGRWRAHLIANKTLIGCSVAECDYHGRPCSMRDHETTVHLAPCCDECGKRFEHFAAWKSHLKTHSRARAVQVQCCMTGCSESGTSVDIDEHMRSVHAFPVCPTCFKDDFSIYANFDRHLSVCSRTFPCDVRIKGQTCDWVGTKNDREAHWKSAHLFPLCDDCGETYEHKSAWKQHVAACSHPMVALKNMRRLAQRDFRTFVVVTALDGLTLGWCEIKRVFRKYNEYYKWFEYAAEGHPGRTFCLKHGGYHIDASDAKVFLYITPAGAVQQCFHDACAPFMSEVHNLIWTNSTNVEMQVSLARHAAPLTNYEVSDTAGWAYFHPNLPTNMRKHPAQDQASFAPVPLIFSGSPDDRADAHSAPDQRPIPAAIIEEQYVGVEREQKYAENNEIVHRAQRKRRRKNQGCVSVKRTAQQEVLYQRQKSLLPPPRLSPGIVAPELPEVGSGFQAVIEREALIEHALKMQYELTPREAKKMEKENWESTIEARQQWPHNLHLNESE